eukprot:scaffold1868_cov178-Amphora_coffeaeformis.AAC.7
MQKKKAVFHGQCLLFKWFLSFSEWLTLLRATPGLFVGQMRASRNKLRSESHCSKINRDLILKMRVGSEFRLHED